MNLTSVDFRDFFCVIPDITVVDVQTCGFVVRAHLLLSWSGIGESETNVHGSVHVVFVPLCAVVSNWLTSCFDASVAI